MLVAGAQLISLRFDVSVVSVQMMLGCVPLVTVVFVCLVLEEGSLRLLSR